MAARDTDKTICARPAETVKASWIAGSAGRNTCIDIGPSAVIDARIIMRSRGDAGAGTISYSAALRNAPARP